MRKFFIILITGVGIISAIALYFIVDNFNINTMDTTERMTFFLQVLAGFVTACISIWGLTIADRQIKHWEIDRCDKFWEEYNPQHIQICDKILNKKNIDDKLIIEKFNIWESISLLEKKSYIDRDILYDRFYVSLFNDLNSSYFDDYLRKTYQDNSHIFYQTRTLYIKWKERYDSEKDHKDSWEKMQKLIKKAREK